MARTASASSSSSSIASGVNEHVIIVPTKKRSTRIAHHAVGSAAVQMPSKKKSLSSAQPHGVTTEGCTAVSNKMKLHLVHDEFHRQQGDEYVEGKKKWVPAKDAPEVQLSKLLAKFHAASVAYEATSNTIANPHPPNGAPKDVVAKWNASRLLERTARDNALDEYNALVERLRVGPFKSHVDEDGKYVTINSTRNPSCSSNKVVPRACDAASSCNRYVHRDLISFIAAGTVHCRC